MKVILNDNYPYTHDEDESEEVEEEEKQKGQRKIKKGFVIGDIKFKDTNWKVEPMYYTNMIGDYYFDFSKAYIPEKRTPIKIKGWIGDIKMLIPEDLPVRIYIKVKIGDIKIFDGNTEDLIRSEMYYESPDYQDSVKNSI